MSKPLTDLDHLLREIRQGNGEAKKKMVEIIEDQLHQIAHHLMKHEDRDHTLQTTALVNEAVLTFLQGDHLLQIKDRLHLFATMTSVMRHILIDYKRKKSSLKRGGEKHRVPLEFALKIASPDSERFWDELENALVEFNQLHPRAGTVVEMKFFWGHTMEKIAEILNISLTTVEGDWRFARTWLRQQLDD